MKKINSIEFAPCVFRLIILLLAAIPLVTSLLLNCFPFWPLLFIQRLSIATGLGITAALLLIGLVEFWQDRHMNNYYQRNQNKKVQLPNGNFECQHCGYAKVHASSSSCPVCNVNFTERSVTDEKPTAWYLRW